MQNLLHMYNWCYFFNFSVNGIIFDSMFMFCGSKVTNISAAQFNGTQCKENCQQLGLLRLHQTSKVRVCMVRNFNHFQYLEIVFSSYYWTSSESEIALDGLNEQCLLFV